MRRGKWLLVGLVAMLVASACGTRLPDKAFVASGARTNSATGTGGDVTGGDAGTAGGGNATAAGPAGSADASSASGGSAAASGSGTGTASGGAKTATASGGTTSGGATASGGTAAKSGSAPAAGGGGGASDVGVTANEITVGNITAIGGPLGPEAFTGLYHGARAFFAALNDKGGINGRKIKYLTCDDKENADRDRQCAQQLVEQQKIFAFVGNSTETYAAASYVNGKGVPDVGGEPIGNAYYKYPHLYSILGANYPRDGKTIGQGGTLYAQTGAYKFFKEKVAVSKAAVFFYAIAISRTAGLFIADGLKREGIEPVYFGGGSDAGENPAAPSFDTDVIQMRNKGVDGIWNAIDIAGFQKLCQSMDRFNFQVKANVSTVQGMSQKVGQDFSTPCRNSVFINTSSRSYADTGNASIAEIRAAMAKYDGNYRMHQWVVEGWAGAKMLTDGIASMGANPTRVGLEKWLNSLKAYTAGGLMASTDYGPKDYSKPAPECLTINQWQDSAKTFVAKAPAFTCITTAYYGYKPQDDGS